MCSKMSDVRLSNASPTVERVDARQQDSVRSVRRVLFGTPDREETRRYAAAVAQDEAQDFMERYNFDLVNEMPLSPGNYQWQEDSDAPEFYRRPPHRSQRPAEEAGSPNGNHRQEDGERGRTRPARLSDSARKRRLDASGSCSNECPGKRSHTDEDDDEDQSSGAGSQAASVETTNPAGQRT